MVKFIKMIHLFLGEFWSANEKIFSTHFASIPNMIDNTFASPKFNQTDGTLSPRQVLTFNRFGTMDLKPMNSKSLASPELSLAKIATMSFTKNSNGRRHRPLSDDIGKLKRASLHHHFLVRVSVVTRKIAPIAKVPIHTMGK